MAKGGSNSVVLKLWFMVSGTQADQHFFFLTEDNFDLVM